MTYRPLVPCRGCARHVLAAEAACPFCGASLGAPDALRRADLPRRPTRAMLFTFGAVLSTAACGSTVPGNGNDGGSDVPTVTDAGDARDAGPREAGPPDDDGGPMPEYGAPPDRDAGASPSRDASPPDDDGGVNADYGAPPDRDAGGGVMPLYGAPPTQDADWV